MIFVSIDQSFSNTGLAIYRNSTPISLVSLKSPKIKGRDRLFYFYDRFREISIYLRDQADMVLIGIEGCAYNKPFYAHDLGTLYAAITLALRDYPIKTYPPLSHRLKALGKAKFGGTPTEKKKKIVWLVNQKFNLELTDHNQADAVSVVQALIRDWSCLRNDLGGKHFEFFIKGMSDRDIDILVKYLEQF